MNKYDVVATEEDGQQYGEYSLSGAEALELAGMWHDEMVDYTVWNLTQFRYENLDELEANVTRCRHGIESPDAACGVCRRTWSLDLVSKVTGRMYGPAPVSPPSGLAMNQVFVTTPVGNPREKYDAEDAAYEWAERGSRWDRVAEYEARTEHPRTYRRTPVAGAVTSWELEARDAEALAEWHQLHDKLRGRVVERDYSQVVPPKWWRVADDEADTTTWAKPTELRVEDTWPGWADWDRQYRAEVKAYCVVEPGEMTPAQWRAAGRPAHVMG